MCYFVFLIKVKDSNFNSILLFISFYVYTKPKVVFGF